MKEINIEVGNSVYYTGPKSVTVNSTITYLVTRTRISTYSDELRICIKDGPDEYWMPACYFTPVITKKMIINCLKVH